MSEILSVILLMYECNVEHIIIGAGMCLHLCRIRFFDAGCELIYPSKTSSVFALGMLLMLRRLSSEWVNVRNLSKYSNVKKFFIYLLNILVTLLLNDLLVNLFSAYFFQYTITRRGKANTEHEFTIYEPTLKSSFIALTVLLIGVQVYGISLLAYIKPLWRNAFPNALVNFRGELVNKEEVSILYIKEAYEEGKAISRKMQKNENQGNRQTKLRQKKRRGTN